MADLPPCRWRETRQGGGLRCRSAKFVAPPNDVSAAFCAACVYADHHEASVEAAPSSPELDAVRGLLPNPTSAVVSAKRVDGLPPIFCITCWQTPERTRKAAAHFRERGLDVQFFPGIHGASFGLRSRYHSGEPMPQGHTGLVLSHYMLWQTLAYLPHDEVLILEDDAWFDADFAERFRLARADLPADWQFAFVGGVALHGKHVEPVTSRVGVMRYPCGTHAYLVKRSTLPLLLHTNHRAGDHIDLQLIQHTLPRLQCYTFTPSLAKQRGACAADEGTGENWPTLTAVADSFDDVDSIDGWFGFSDVYDLAVERARNGETFVEIGVWKGKSTAYLAKRLQQSGKQVRFFAIDTFQGSLDEDGQQDEITRLQADRRTLYDVFTDNLVRCGVRGLVTPVIADSAEAARRFADRSVAFCFIDGGHSYGAVRRDLDAWLPKIAPGGLIAGDDFAFPGVAQAVRETFGDRFQLSRQHHKSWIAAVAE